MDSELDAARSQHAPARGIKDLHRAAYGNLSPVSKKMFIVHRRGGVPLIIHKRIPYIVHRKRMDMGLDGFHGDTFSNGFGEFGTVKRMGGDANFGYGDTFSQGFGDFGTVKRMDGDTNFGYGDTFSGGFGDFATV
jgi:hypothetical protein